MKKTVVLMLSCLIGAALGFGIAALADGKSSGDVSFFGTFLNIAGRARNYEVRRIIFAEEDYRLDMVNMRAVKFCRLLTPGAFAFL